MTRGDRTHRWTLAALTGGVIASALVVVVLVPLLLGVDAPGTPAWAIPLHVAMVALAGAALMRVRVRSAVAGISWTDSAILVCIVSLPAGWVAPCVFAGVFLGKLVGRIRPYKALYNASKDTLSAGAGLLVALHFGLGPGTSLLDRPLELVVVAVTISVVEFVVGVPVLAVVSQTPWYRVHGTDADIKLAFFAGKLSVTMVALLVFADYSRLLALLVPVAVGLHLLTIGRLRARSDRIALQRLARTAERLDAPEPATPGSVPLPAHGSARPVSLPAHGSARPVSLPTNGSARPVDLDTVLTRAVTEAVSLFGAEHVEVYLRDAPHGPRLARAGANGDAWTGDPSGAMSPRRGTFVVAVPMAGDGEHLGEIRLHLGAGLGLQDRELLTLRTFASTVRAAVRNALATDEMVRSSADARRHDPLTGLVNREGLLELGEVLLDACDDAALVALEIDGLRDVNESLGHGAGDRVLVEIAHRLSTVAGPDDIVARLHGDVFAVLLTGVAGPQAVQRAGVLLECLSASLDAGGVRVRVQATAGLAERNAVRTAAPAAVAVLAGGARPLAGPGDREASPPADVTMLELLRRADVARTQGRRGGPRVARYEPHRDPADVDALVLGEQLPRAIAEHQFMICFQPIVALDSGLMIGAEALVRWRHPDRGNLLPRDFLDAVQRSGLLASFEEAVLDQALAAQARWRELGVRAPVAVNVGQRSLLDPQYPALVRRMLSRHGVTAGDLVVEVTESLTVDDLELAGPALAELARDGVRVSLDDFGTRASSLTMVVRVPGADLKIDQQFVKGLGVSPEASAVVRATVELGHTLGRSVVAEGVEREDQRRALWELGCRAGQGHLFARAVPIEELLRMLAPGVDGVPGRIARPLD